MGTDGQSLGKAALWMGGWLALMVTMAVAGRETASRLNVFQVMEIRAITGFLMLMPLVWWSGGLNAVRTAKPLRHVTRNFVHYVAQYGWLVAVTLIPLAQVISIEFTMPIWTAILAVIFLGEKMNPWKITAIVLGLAGVIIIVRPDAGHVSTGQLISLASAVGFAISVILVKSMTRTDKPVTIIFWMLIIGAIQASGWPAPARIASTANRARSAGTAEIRIIRISGSSRMRRRSSTRWCSSAGIRPRRPATRGCT